VTLFARVVIIKFKYGKEQGYLPDLGELHSAAPHARHWTGECEGKKLQQK